MNLDQYKQEPHVIKGQGITMTRVEADHFMQAIGKSMQDCTTEVRRLQRKRTGRRDAHAVAIADLTARAEYLTALRARIGTAFNLGGW